MAGERVQVVGQRGISIYADGQDITARAQNVNCQNGDPGGYLTAAFELPGFVRIAKGAPVIYRDGAEVMWQGRVSEGGVSDDGRNSLTRVQCEGYGAQLSDNSMAMLYAKTTFDGWNGPSVEQRKVLIAAGIPVSRDGYVAGDSTEPAVVTALTGAWAANTRSEMWFDAGPLCQIAIMMVGNRMNPTLLTPADANWSILASLIELGNSAAGIGIDSSANLNAATNTATVAASGVRRYARVRSGYAIAAGTAQQQYEVYWTAIGLYGPHGLPLQGGLSATNITLPPGIDASDIARDAAQRAGMNIGVVVASGFINRNAVYLAPVPHRTPIEDQAGITGFHWGVWASPSAFAPNPEFHFRPPPPDATALVARGDCHAFDVTSRLGDLYSAAQVTYTDPAGGTGVVTVTADNAALARPRTLPLNMGAGTADLARYYGQAALRLSQSVARAAGSLTVPREVQLIGGGGKPAHLLRSGLDRLRVTGLPSEGGPLLLPDTRATDTFRVSRVDTSVDATGRPDTRVDVDAGSNLLDVLVARLSSVNG